MPKRKAIVRAGEKVLSTDVGQAVVGGVVDSIERVVVDKSDDAADAVKERARKAGERGKRSSTRTPAPKRAAASSSRKKSTSKRTAKKSPTKKASRKRTTAKSSTAKRGSAKKSTAKRGVAKKSTAKRSTAARKSKT